MSLIERSRPKNLKAADTNDDEEAAKEAQFERLGDKLELLTGRIYRYSRPTGLTNDEMGYGERITDPLWRVHSDGRLESTTQTSQRTKSGRQLLIPPPTTKS